MTKLRTLLAGYSNIFFMGSPAAGAVILLLSFGYPSVGVHGLVAALLSLGYWSWKTRNQASLTPTRKLTPPFNAILCGTYLGFWMQPSPQSFLFLLAVWYTNLLFHSVLDVLVVRRGLPVLSLPFSLTCLLFGPSIQAHRSASLGFSFVPPEFWKAVSGWSSGSVFWDQVFQSLGSVMFIPVSAVGAVILALTFLHSRFIFTGIIGSLTLSWVIHSILYPISGSGAHPAEFWNWSHFTFALLGASLGGVFFIPSFATVPVIFASFWSGLISYYALLYFFQYRVESIHSFPLCFGTLVGVYLARSSFPQGINQNLNDSMEKVMALLKVKVRRFGTSPCILELPLTEPVHILQGFNGPWTHQGRWRYALDFVISDPRGKSHEDAGQNLTDYFIFGKTVVSPAAGWVIRIEDQAEDGQIGKLSFRGNWGNSLLLKTTSGYYVLLAHLKKRSLLVKEGSYVITGQALAEVGNSGYSLEPHLHLQVQESPDRDAETIPFHFRSYEDSEKNVCLYETPQASQALSPVRINQTLQWAFNFKPDQEIQFEHQGRVLTLRTGLDPKNGFWFFEEPGIPGRAYFWKDDQEFYFFEWRNLRPDSFLSIFALILGRVPFALGSTLRWKNYVTPDQVKGQQFKLLTSLGEKFRMFFTPWKALCQVEYRMESDGTRIYCSVKLNSKHTLKFEVALDPWEGIRSLEFEGKVWTRKPPAAQ